MAPVGSLAETTTPKAMLSIMNSASESSANDREERIVLYGDTHADKMAKELDMPKGPFMEPIDPKERPNQLFKSHQTLECFKRRMFWANKSIEAFVYEIDHTQIVKIMKAKVSWGVHVALL